MGKDFKDGCLRASPAFAGRFETCPYGHFGLREGDVLPLPSPLDSGFRWNDGGCMPPLRLARRLHSGVRRLGRSRRRRGRRWRLGMRRLRFA